MTRHATRAAMVLVLLGLSVASGLLIPLGHTLWSEQLGVSGAAQVAGGVPPPSDSPIETLPESSTTPTDLGLPATPSPEAATPVDTPEPTATALPPTVTVAAPNTLGAELEASITVAPVLALADGRYLIRGELCVSNTGAQPTDGLSFGAQVQFEAASNAWVDLLEATYGYAPAEPLPPGVRQCYPVEIAFTPLPGARYQLAARVILTNHSGWLPGDPQCPGPAPCAFSLEARASFALPDEPQAPPDLNTPTTVPLPTEPSLPPPTEEPAATEAASPTSLPAESTPLPTAATTGEA